MSKKNPKTAITNSDLLEAVDTIIQGVDKMFKDQNEKIDTRFNKLETEVRFIRQDVSDIKHNYVDRSQFTNLKKRLDSHISSH